MIVLKHNIEVGRSCATWDKYFYSMFRMEVGNIHIGLTLPDMEALLKKFTHKYKEIVLTVELAYRKRTFRLKAENGRVERL